MWLLETEPEKCAAAFTPQDAATVLAKIPGWLAAWKSTFDPHKKSSDFTVDVSVFDEITWQEPIHDEWSAWLSRGLGNVEWVVRLLYALDKDDSIVPKLWPWLMGFVFRNNTIPPTPFRAKDREEVLWYYREGYPGDWIKPVPVVKTPISQLRITKK